MALDEEIKYEERVEKKMTVWQLVKVAWKKGQERSESQNQAEVLVLTGFNMLSSLLDYERGNFCDTYPDSVGRNL